MTGHSDKIDVLIVGGGIIGLWSAYSILVKNPNLSVVVAEAERYLAEHTTGRNSEVLHSGLYYPTGSLKHVHCMQGNELWRKYIRDKNLPILACGKLIVANENQRNELDALFQRGKENGLTGIKYLTNKELSDLQRHIDVDLGFLVPSSAVVSVSDCVKSLRNDIESMGGIILTSSSVKIQDFAKEYFQLSINGDQIISNNLINAAGLFAITIRENLGLVDYDNFYVKGNYLKLKKKMDLHQLIYPIPPADGLGLGVHLTLDISGGQKFGPNTEVANEIDYSVSDELIPNMIPSIKTIFKNVSLDDLSLGYAGIRPKIKKNGKLITDFIFNTPKQLGINGYYEFLGIESPGLTSAPSLAKKLCESF